MQSSKKTEMAQKKLIERIESKTGAKIQSYELAELRGTSESLEKLGIHSKSGLGTAWGLVLFTSDGLYFYYPATEGMFDFFFRQNSGEGPAEDQFVKLSDKEELAFSLPKKTFFSIFSATEKFTVLGSCKIKGEEVLFHFSFMNKAAPIFEKMTALLK